MAAEISKPVGRIGDILPFAVAFTAFTAMAALYVTGSVPLYEGLLITWGIEPFPTPFVDTDTVLSAVRCLRAGVDVYAINPCDPLHRVYDYSPLWLLLAKLPFTEAWTMPAGLVVDGAFLLSLLLLPRARDRRALFALILGILSSAVVFAMERANNDLVLFALAAAAAWLACRSPVLRLLGYAAALLAGLLKYYPMLLMLIASRERPVRFFAIAAASIAIVALFLMAMGHDLVRALQLIPDGDFIGDMFGGSTLPGGLAGLFGWPASGATALHLALGLGALVVGLAAGLSTGIGAALDRLSEPERSALLAGALLIIGCFFTAQNIGYRATHLLLVLPALTALWRLDGRPLWSFATASAIALLWSQGWRAALARLSDAPAVTVGAWLVREALWWGLVTLLIALVASLIARSTMGEIVFRRRRSPSAPA